MLNQKQIKALNALISTSTVVEASKVSGIPRKTINEWLKDNKEFKSELQRLQNQALSEGVSYLKVNMTKCNQKLLEIIEHEGVNASVKVQAIQTFYNACTRFVELTEILQRIEVLENAKVITD